VRLLQPTTESVENRLRVGTKRERRLLYVQGRRTRARGHNSDVAPSVLLLLRFGAAFIPPGTELQI